MEYFSVVTFGDNTESIHNHGKYSNWHDLDWPDLEALNWSKADIKYNYPDRKVKSLVTNKNQLLINF